MIVALCDVIVFALQVNLDVFVKDTKRDKVVKDKGIFIGEKVTTVLDLIWNHIITVPV